MAQVKIYGLRSHLSPRQNRISDGIHQALMEALELPEEKRFQRFFPLESDEFRFPRDRSDAYTIIEISLFAGRSEEAKRALIRALFRRLSERAGIPTQDLEITIFEAPMSSWGIRGFIGDELNLPYRVSL